VFAEDHVGGRDAYGLGRHDLVGEGVGHHAVLVDAGLVGEGVGSDYGLVGRTAEADELGEQLAGGVELIHLDVVGVGELVAADHEGGGDLFEGSVAGTLADAVDGALDLSGSALDAGERVGYGHAEVVVAVGGEDDVFDAGHLGEEHAEGGGVLVGRGVTDGVGDVDGGGSGLDGDGDDLDEEVGVGAGGVLGGELDVVGEGAGEADGFGGLMEGLGAGDLELGFEVEVGGGEEGVDAGFIGRLDCMGGGFDVLALSTGERGDAGAADLAGDSADGVGVALAGDGEAGFEDVDAEGRELMGHAELFVVVHGAAGRLFAVAEGGVEEDDFVR
jgi:hypothetical protein